jgi:GMP reductase
LKLDFNNVLIRPSPTELESRSLVNLKRTFNFKYSTQQISCVPIMAANMDTTGTLPVFNVLSKHSMVTCFNKFIDTSEIKNFIRGKEDLFAFSIGFKEKELNDLIEISKIIDFKIICIDIANGYINSFVNFCQKVRKHFPDKIIIAGNVVTPHMTQKLIVEGKVDIVKVGIGGGSACTTRIKTGVGYPQLSCIIECRKAARNVGGYIISDGGITCPGDLGKAFGGGADFVMIGGQFAGHDENPGEIVQENGKLYKLFYGMSSSHAMEKNYGKVEKYRTSEGRCMKIPYKGELEGTVRDFLGGLRSTCTYVNCKNLEEMPALTTFIRVSSQFNSSLI